MKDEITYPPTSGVKVIWEKDKAVVDRPPLPAGRYLLVVLPAGGYRLWNADYLGPKRHEQSVADAFDYLNDEAQREFEAAMAELDE